MICCLNLPSLDFFFLVNSSSALELGGLVHEDETWQRRCREDKLLGVHINLLIKLYLIIIYHVELLSI